MHATFNYPVFSIQQSCSSEDGSAGFPAIILQLLTYFLARRHDPDREKVRWMTALVASPSYAPFFLKMCLLLRLPQIDKFKRLIVNNSTIIHISL